MSAQALPPEQRPGPRLAPGDVIAGKYVVERAVGEGGMGVVVAARHLQLNDRVAIKVLGPQSLDSSDTVERLQREAQVAVRIKTEHVARVHDIGVLDGGLPYIVMEYLEGVDLAQRLKRSGPVATADAIDFVLQACVAVAEAHALEIVHRDLKPSNLFVTTRRDGHRLVKVLDFGISKSLSAQRTLTASDAFVGSPCYMSPEQMSSAHDVDGRADIWSLGVTLFELISGKLPFSGESVPQLCVQVTQGRPRTLRDIGMSVQPGLEAVIMSCLEQDPGKRPQTVADLAQALLPYGNAAAIDLVGQISRVQRYSSVSFNEETEEKDMRPLLPTVAASHTQVSWRKGSDGKPHAASRWRLSIGLGLVFGVSALLLMGYRVGLTGDMLSAPDAASPPRHTIGSGEGAAQTPRYDSAPAQSAVSSPLAPSALALPPSAAPATATSPPPRPRVPAGLRAIPPRRAQPASGISGRPSDACRDPRYVDQDGIVRIRRECVR